MPEELAVHQRLISLGRFQANGSGSGGVKRNAAANANGDQMDPKRPSVFHPRVVWLSGLRFQMQPVADCNLQVWYNVNGKTVDDLRNAPARKHGNFEDVPPSLAFTASWAKAFPNSPNLQEFISVRPPVVANWCKMIAVSAAVLEWFGVGIINPFLALFVLSSPAGLTVDRTQAFSGPENFGDLYGQLFGAQCLRCCVFGFFFVML